MSKQNAYAATLDAHRRLCILTHLAHCLDYASNSEILLDVCNGLGIATSRDRLIGTLAWLNEQGLIDLEDRLCLELGDPARCLQWAGYCHLARPAHRNAGLAERAGAD